MKRIIASIKLHVPVVVAFFAAVWAMPGIYHGNIQAQEKKNDLRVYYHVFNFPVQGDEDVTSFQTYIQVPYDQLAFVLEDDVYKAKYQVDLLVLSNREPVSDKSWRKNITVFDFKETQSNELFAQWEYIENLKPGNYEFDITVTDLNSYSTAQGRQVVTVKDFSGKGLHVSDIAFLNDLNIESGGERKLTPSMKNNIPENAKNFLAYMEIHSRKTGEELTVFYKIIDDLYGDNRIVKNGTVQITKENEVEYFSLNLADLGLQIGRYMLIVDITDGKLFTKTQKNFSVDWAWIPGVIKDFPMAVEQMAYINSDRQQKNLEKLEPAEQLRTFKAFWDSVDTDPLTEESEPMLEYYSRVNYAMQHFNTYKKWQDGWKTDRGRVYILMGPPDYIEHNPHSASSNPYDVWYYYFPRRFYLFVDRTGMGDYRLQNIQDLHHEDSTWWRMGIGSR